MNEIIEEQESNSESYNRAVNRILDKSVDCYDDEIKILYK